MAALHVIASLLADRHGVFTRAQLRSAGVSSKRVRHALECGLWVPVLHGAFVAAAQPIGPWQRGAAAVAVTGGVVSHHSAATLLGLALPTDTVHVTTGRTPRYVPAGVTAHHVELGGRDTCRRLGVVVTSPQRTAVDCAATLPFGSAMDFVREAMFRGWVDLASLHEAVGQRPRRHGTPQLTRIVAVLADGGRSRAERVAHRHLRTAGITGWRANVVLRDARGVIGEVDLLFEVARLVVEIDGYAVHGRREAFQRDRTKQNRLIAAGYTVLRFTWDDVQNRPHAFVSQIRAALLSNRAV